MIPFPSFYKSLFLLWLGHLFMDFCTGIWPIYKTIAQINIAQAGLIMGVSGFLGEILQIVFGYFCDQGHRKKVLLLGLILSSSILWITFSNNILNCFILLLLMMLGSSSFHPAATGFAGGLTKEQKGRIILFFASGGAIGLGISQLVFTSLISRFNGHVLILFIPLGVILLFLFFHRFPEQATKKSSSSFKEFVQPILLSRKPLFFLYLSQVASQGFIYAFMFMLPDLLLARGCHNWLCLGGGHLCFILGSALTMVPAGFLCDRYGQKIVLLFVVFFSIFFLYLFLFYSSFSILGTMFVLACLGAFLGIISPIAVSWGNLLVPENPSTVSALLMGFAWCFSHLGPASAGLLSTFFTTNPFVITMSLLGISLIAILFFITQIPHPKKISDSP